MAGTLVPPPREEIPQKLGGNGRGDPGIHFGPVMALRMREHARAVLYRSTLFVDGPVIQAGDPRMGDCPGAHGTWLQRHVEVAIRQSVPSQHSRSPPQCDNFRMGGRIAVATGEVVRFGDDSVAARYHCPDRDFTVIFRTSRHEKGALHGIGNGPLAHSGALREGPAHGNGAHDA